jgi:hypothetical protein
MCGCSSNEQNSSQPIGRISYVVLFASVSKQASSDPLVCMCVIRCLGTALIRSHHLLRSVNARSEILETRELHDIDIFLDGKEWLLWVKRCSWLPSPPTERPSLHSSPEMPHQARHVSARLKQAALASRPPATKIRSLNLAAQSSSSHSSFVPIFVDIVAFGSLHKCPM